MRATKATNETRSEVREYAVDPPEGWTSAWSWCALDGGDRATRGANARALFHAPELHECARVGDAGEVTRLLDSGAFELDAKDPAGRTALHFAVGFGRLDVAEELLRRGCELEPRDCWKKAPVDWGIQARHDACVEALRVEAVKRGMWGGRGRVAPLKTYYEHCYNLTAEQVEAMVVKSARGPRTVRATDRDESSELRAAARREGQGGVKAETERSKEEMSAKECSCITYICLYSSQRPFTSSSRHPPRV